MSAEALSWAKRQTTGNMGRKATLLLLADIASEHGVLWAGANYLADLLECNRTTVLEHLKRLAEDGLIGRYERNTASGRKATVTLLAPHGDRGSMRDATEHDIFGRLFTEAQVGISAFSQVGISATPSRDSRPEPTVEPTLPSGQGERAGAAVKFGGKPVNAESWEKAQRVLAEFNEQAGMKVRPVKSSGEMSEGAKRVYRAVRDYPDISEAEFADIIRRTLASRWWGADDPNPGVVFGQKVFEDNITRDPEGRKGRDAKRDALNDRLREIVMRRHAA